MSTIELKEKLIHTIQTTENENILQEIYRLLEIEAEPIEIYKLNDLQNKAVAEARVQIRNGQFLTEEAADKEIDEWLEK